MATISELADRGDLERIEAELDGKLAWRCLFGTPAFVRWLEEVLPTLQSGIMDAPTSPAEQVDALFFEFISGEQLLEDRRFRALSRTPDLYVWELKTVDVRIFGWFVEMDKFVCCFGDLKDEVLRLNKVGTYMAQTDFIRNGLDLDMPKQIEFKEYANVLSNADRR